MSLLSPKQLVALHPRLELLAKSIYWRNASAIDGKLKLAKGFFSRKSTSRTASDHDFQEMLKWFAEFVRERAEISIIHSSFDSLKGNSRSALSVLSGLLDAVGAEHTVAMPTGRRFRGEPTKYERLFFNTDELVLDYDPLRTPIWTGILPLALVRHPNSVTSLTPINPLVAIGPEASSMFAMELNSSRILPHGHNSAWSYCIDRGALAVGIGVDLVHSLTAVHVIEDRNWDTWPVKDWYRIRRFRVADARFKGELEVMERLPKWGMLHFCERRLRKDLIKAGILRFKRFGELPIEWLDTQELITYLEPRFRTGYPYFNVPLEPKVSR